MERKKIRFVSGATEVWKHREKSKCLGKNHELCLVLVESKNIVGL